MPRAYLTRLMDPENASWGPPLVAENFNRLFRNMRDEGDDNTGAYLARSVTVGEREEIRGFLSSRFRRLDSRPILSAFAAACDQIGAVPVEGYATVSRHSHPRESGVMPSPIS
jgi:hypothetical protein